MVRRKRRGTGQAAALRSRLYSAHWLLMRTCLIFLARDNPGKDLLQRPARAQRRLEAAEAAARLAEVEPDEAEEDAAGFFTTACLRPPPFFLRRLAFSWAPLRFFLGGLDADGEPGSVVVSCDSLPSAPLGAS